MVQMVPCQRYGNSLKNNDETTPIDGSIDSQSANNSPNRYKLISSNSVSQSGKTIHRNPCPDLIKGTRFDEDISGHQQRDTIHGGHGSDQLPGGTGDDVLRGGSGHVKLYVGKGHDKLRCGQGSDNLNGRRGNDVLH